MDLIKGLGFYYPTQVMCVDDDLDFLKSLERGLGARFRLEMEQNPIVALKKLSTHPVCNNTDLVAKIPDDELDQDYDCPINVSISKISDLIYRSNRYDDISVLIVDYSMPEMTGLALCEELKCSRLKKIMLTGEKDQSLAIEAFNKGVIDHFIRKDHPDLEGHLEAVIKLLQQKYFQECTAFILTAVQTAQGPFLGSAPFLREFNRFLKHHHIVEFYLLDMTGSFLGLDAKGCPYWFLAKTEGQMMDLINIAESGDTVSEVVQALRDRSALVYFLREEERNLELEEWPGLAHPITLAVNGIYLSWVEGPIRGFKT